MIAVDTNVLVRLLINDPDYELQLEIPLTPILSLRDGEGVMMRKLVS